MDSTTPSLDRLRGDRAFFGHPRGLGYLAFTEGFVGFSYYGMQAILVLYLVGYLLTPAHEGHVLLFGPFRAAMGAVYGAREGQPLAAAIVGLYSALIFAVPILGGLLADKLLGRTRTIILGAVLMTLGHFLMTFDATFLMALSLIIAGMGCAGTLKAQVGGLYTVTDLRRADAFQVYTLALNAAVIAAPLVCGTLGQSYAWHWGFAAAGIGMLIGLVVYLSGLKHLPPEPTNTRDGQHVPQPPLTPREWKTVLVLVSMLPVVALTGVGNQEIFNGYLVWGQANYALVFFGKTMPVSWLISLDAIISVATLLGVVMFWRWWGKRHREPDEIVKLAIGAFIAALAPLTLAAASTQATGGHKVGLLWGVAFHVINDIGFAHIYPVGLALFSRCSPRQLGATLVNSFVLYIFLANLLVGYLAGLLLRMSGAAFWSMHAAIILGAACVIVVYARLFHRLLAPERPVSA